MHVCMSLMNIDDVLGSYAMMVGCKSSSRTCFCLICGNKEKNIANIASNIFLCSRTLWSNTNREKMGIYIDFYNIGDEFTKVVQRIIEYSAVHVFTRYITYYC